MKILAVTGCTTGIAHTYMAAELLNDAAKKRNIDIKVETRGSIGVENELTREEIENSDGIIIASDIDIPMERFIGKKVLIVQVSEALKDTEDLFDKLEKCNIYKGDEGEKKSIDESVQEIKEIKKNRKKEIKGPYKHLLNGVSYMIPFVVAGGILIALSFAFGGYNGFEKEGSLAAALMNIGGGAGAFGLIVPILSGYMAYSIADRPGLAPGMIGGIVAVQLNSGFLGGIVAGFLAGYTVLLIKKSIRLPNSLQGIMPVLIIPVIGTLIVGLLMVYVLGKPVAAINDGMTNFLTGLQGVNAIALGLIIGLMMAFDMGGPVNKAAYTFGTGTLAGLAAGEGSAVMAAVMAAGMVPPLGLALATAMFGKKFSKSEKEAGKAAWVLGISFITEGAIPFAAADPFRVIPSIMIGSAVAGAISMAANCTLAVSHGGIFVIPFVKNIGLYTLAIIVGMIISALLVGVLKKKQTV